MFFFIGRLGKKKNNFKVQETFSDFILFLNALSLIDV